MFVSSVPAAQPEAHLEAGGETSAAEAIADDPEPEQAKEKADDLEPEKTDPVDPSAEVKVQ